MNGAGNSVSFLHWVGSKPRLTTHSTSFLTLSWFQKHYKVKAPRIRLNDNCSLLTLLSAGA